MMPHHHQAGAELPANWQSVVRDACCRWATLRLPLAELAQHASAEVLAAVQATERIGNPTAFVYCVARRAAGQLAQRERVHLEYVAEGVDPDDTYSAGGDPAELASGEDDWRAVADAFSSLRPAELRAIRGRLAGMTDAEIATAHQTTPDAVKVAAARGRQQLRALLGGRR